MRQRKSKVSFLLKNTKRCTQPGLESKTAISRVKHTNHETTVSPYFSAIDLQLRHSFTYGFIRKNSLSSTFCQVNTTWLTLKSHLFLKHSEQDEKNLIFWTKCKSMCYWKTIQNLVKISNKSFFLSVLFIPQSALDSLPFYMRKPSEIWTTKIYTDDLRLQTKMKHLWITLSWF